MLDVPVAIPAVRMSSALDPPSSQDGSLASATNSDIAAARARLQTAIELAHRLAVPRVLLDLGPIRVPGEPGPDDLGDPRLGWTKDLASAQTARRNVRRDAALDVACRALFSLLRATPDIEFCLTPSRQLLGLGEPDALAAIFEDLNRPRLRFWHDTAVAAHREALLDEPQGKWLELFGNRLAGITLGDSTEGTLYTPPGSGGVDYPLVAAYRRRTGRPLPTVVELDLGVGEGDISGVNAFLDKHGL